MKAKISKIGPYIILGISFLLVVCLNVFCHDHWLDSDMAAEMMFSELLAQEGHLFATPDWYYSTEFRFLYTHLIMGPLFRICGDWHVIRAITNIVSYVLMLGAYYYFMKPLKVQKGLVITTSAILLLPFSETMMTHMVMGNTYMFHVVIVFLFFGLYLRLAERDVKAGKLRLWLELLAFIALGVICGVSGVRYLLALQCPLALTALIRLWSSKEFGDFRQNLSGQNLGAECKKLWQSDSMKWLLWAVAGVVAAVAGYAINVLYVSKNYVFQTYEATNFIAVYQGVFWERVQNALGSLLMLFGYIPDKGVISLRGVVTLAAFAMIAVFAYVAIKVRKRHFVSLFFIVSFCLNVFVFVFTTSTMVPRYYLTVIIFVLPALCFYMEQEKLYFDKLLVTVLLVGCLLLATGKTVLSYVTVDKNADKRAVAEFLAENDYDFGYATYWNANIITELTDGQVEIANVWDPVNMNYFKWSSPMKYYEANYKDGEVFLLLTAGEVATVADGPVVQEGEVVYEDGTYTVYVYESTGELMSLVGND